MMWLSFLLLYFTNSDGGRCEIYISQEKIDYNVLLVNKLNVTAKVIDN